MTILRTMIMISMFPKKSKKRNDNQVIIMMKMIMALVTATTISP